MRSTYLNQVIKYCIASGHTVLIDDAKATHICETFRQAARIIDSVDICAVTLHCNKHGCNLGSFLCLPRQRGFEQIADYTAGSYMQKLINAVQTKGGLF